MEQAPVIEEPSGGAESTPEHDLLDRALARVPAPLAAFGAVVAVGGTQAGYFPVGWGPSAIALLALGGAWLWFGARTDARRRDLLVLAAFATLVGWTALSVLWSDAPTQSILEVQRLLVPFAGLTGVVLLARRESTADIGLAVMLGITLVAGYGLASRLFPDRIGVFDASTEYRLAEPIGYWNGLGIISAMGLILALGCAVDARGSIRRVACSVPLVVLAPTLYFTYSRGAWIALAIGIVALLAASPRRLEAIGTIAVLAPAPAIAVLAGSRSAGLTDIGSSLTAAVADGHALVKQLVGLAVGAAFAGLLLGLAGRRIRLGSRARLGIGIVLAGAAVVAITGTFALVDPPWTLATRAVDGFEQPDASLTPDLNSRLFHLTGSGRVDIWRAAIDAGVDRPVTGAGAGTFERLWQRDPGWTFKARDAHSLYLETFAELGVVGVLLLVLLFAGIVGTCLGARREAAVPAGLAAFVAFAVHAGVDWDWELTGVTLAALIAGSLGVIASRPGPARRASRPARWATVLGITVVGVVSAIGFLGNDALDRAQYALAIGNPPAALNEARAARRYAPWSPYPLTVAGEAQLALGRVQAARRSFLSAIERDDGYWRAWLGLAVASDGSARRQALARAKELYPRSSAIARTEKLLRRTANVQTPKS